MRAPHAEGMAKSLSGDISRIVTLTFADVCLALGGAHWGQTIWVRERRHLGPLDFLVLLVHQQPSILYQGKQGLRTTKGRRRCPRMVPWNHPQLRIEHSRQKGKNREWKGVGDHANLTGGKNKREGLWHSRGVAQQDGVNSRERALGGGSSMIGCSGEGGG